MHQHLYDNGMQSQQQVGGMPGYMGGPQVPLYGPVIGSQQVPAAPLAFPYGHGPMPGAQQQMYAPAAPGYMPGPQMYAPQTAMYVPTAPPMMQGPQLYAQTQRGGPAVMFGLNGAPRIFGSHPNVEAALKLIQQQIRQGQANGIFPTVETVRAAAAELLPLSHANEPVTRFVNEALYVVPGLLEVAMYISQIYMYVKYIRKIDHPVSPQKAAVYAVSALATEYSIIKGIHPSDQSARLANMRSLQYMWGHLGGFITINTFPMEWDPKDAEERKQNFGGVLIAPAQAAAPLMSTYAAAPQQAMGYSAPYGAVGEQRSQNDMIGLPGLDAYSNRAAAPQTGYTSSTPVFATPATPAAPTPVVVNAEPVGPVEHVTAKLVTEQTVPKVISFR